MFDPQTGDLVKSEDLKGKVKKVNKVHLASLEEVLIVLKEDLSVSYYPALTTQTKSDLSSLQVSFHDFENESLVSYAVENGSLLEQWRLNLKG